MWVGLNLLAWRALGHHLEGSPTWSLALASLGAPLALVPLTKVAGQLSLLLCQVLIAALGLLAASGIGVLVLVLSTFGLGGLAEKIRFDRGLDRGTLMKQRFKRTDGRPGDDVS